ncbi:MAG: universal stress protein [Steroidobacteraceae bacterium]
MYRRILTVVDLTERSKEVVQRARLIATACGNATLELLHVVEYVPVEPLSDSLMPAVQLETELLERARTRLNALVENLQLGDVPRDVQFGNVKSEILRVARERGVDLIVLGSRERHGLSILVNLTEDTVLHGAPCDVLAVRLNGK